MPPALDTQTILIAVIGVLVSVTGTIMVVLVGLTGYFLASLHGRFEAHLVEAASHAERLIRTEAALSHVVTALEDVKKLLENFTKKEKAHS